MGRCRWRLGVTRMVVGVGLGIGATATNLAVGAPPAGVGVGGGDTPGSVLPVTVSPPPRSSLHTKGNGHCESAMHARGFATQPYSTMITEGFSHTGLSRGAAGVAAAAGTCHFTGFVGITIGRVLTSLRALRLRRCGAANSDRERQYRKCANRKMLGRGIYCGHRKPF